MTARRFFVILAIGVLAWALILLTAAALARAASAEPVACEWYPPGWPDDPDWESLDWSILEGDPEVCAVEVIPTDEEVEELPLPGEFGVSSTTGTNVHNGRDGVISHMGDGWPADYLAIPIGPGHLVEVCGPRMCLTLRSTDAGPNREMLQAGRIADVSVELFRALCCDPSRGLFEGSWQRVNQALADQPRVTLPPTDTGP